MKWILFFIVFTLTFFMYIHICHHLKKVNDIDIYDMGYINKKTLEEVCVLRHPVTFLLEEDVLEKYFNLQDLVDKYSNMKIQLYDMSNVDIIPIPLPIKDALKLFNQKKDYLSYNNTSFAEDSLSKSKLQVLDKYLSPPLSVYSEYDVWLGTEDKKLPLKSESYYREYIYVTSGNIECLLITPNQYKKQIILLKKTEVLYIPPYWSYEITFKKNAFICVFRYDTVLSVLTRLPYLLIDYIKKTNTTELSLKLKTSPEEIIDNSKDVSNTNGKEPRTNVSQDTNTIKDASNNPV